MAAAGLAARFWLAPMLDDMSIMELLPDGDTKNDDSDDNSERITESEAEGKTSESGGEENAEQEETPGTEDKPELETGDASDSPNQEGSQSGTKENSPESASDSGDGNTGSKGSSDNIGAANSNGASDSTGGTDSNGSTVDTDSSGGTSGGSDESAQSRIMNTASASEIAQGSAILSKIDAGKFFSLMETDKAAAKKYLYSCLSQSEINTAMELYAKYGSLLN